VTLADDRGTCYGGHLAPGTVVFACEFVVQAFQGPAFERMYDDETGLALWKIAETD
jgi:predicted DNA-binding protein with PD1-like motif